MKYILYFAAFEYRNALLKFCQTIWMKSNRMYYTNSLERWGGAYCDKWGTIRWVEWARCAIGHINVIHNYLYVCSIVCGKENYLWKHIVLINLLMLDEGVRSLVPVESFWLMMSLFVCLKLLHMSNVHWYLKALKQFVLADINRIPNRLSCSFHANNVYHRISHNFYVRQFPLARWMQNLCGKSYFEESKGKTMATHHKFRNNYGSKFFIHIASC